MTNVIQTDEEKFGAVELAYPIALASYELTQKRYDLMDTRLQTLLVFGATISLSIPAIAISKHITFRSNWFYAAAIAFAAAIVIGTTARLMGYLAVITPKMLYDKWLKFSDWEFKKNLIHFAGKHYEQNCDLINRKGRLTSLTALLFFIEAICLTLWVILAQA